MIIYQWIQLRNHQKYSINGETYKCWTAADLIVLKSLSIYIQKNYTNTLGESTHLKDKGGIHQALKQVEAKKCGYPQILKSDVYHYYDSIFIRRVKGRTSRVLRDEFPHLRKRIPTLWTNSYFVSTVGGAPLEIVKQYIENQQLSESKSTKDKWKKYLKDGKR